MIRQRRMRKGDDGWFVEERIYVGLTGNPTEWVTIAEGLNNSCAINLIESISGSRMVVNNAQSNEPATRYRPETIRGDY